MLLVLMPFIILVAGVALVMFGIEEAGVEIEGPFGLDPNHLPLEELCKKAADFGYDGLELACWGDHFEVDKALSDDTYCTRKREQLEKHDLQLFAISVDGKTEDVVYILRKR